MSDKSHDNHVTVRVVVPSVALFLIFTSATFAAIVWSVMLMMMVCVPSLAALGIVFLVTNRGGTYRPEPRPFRLGGRSTRPLPDGRRRAVERPLEGRVLPPVRRSELQRGKVTK